MKTIFMTLGLAVVLFVYGYALSTVGHDHDQHEKPSAVQAHGDAHGDHQH